MVVATVTISESANGYPHGQESSGMRWKFTLRAGARDARIQI